MARLTVCTFRSAVFVSSLSPVHWGFHLNRNRIPSGFHCDYWHTGIFSSVYSVVELFAPPAAWTLVQFDTDFSNPLADPSLTLERSALTLPSAFCTFYTDIPTASVMWVTWKVPGLAEAMKEPVEELTRAWKITKYGMYSVHACSLTHANKAREWKWKLTSPQITHNALPLDWKVSHFLCMHHEFKFGSNFSLWDISCFAINAENSQKPTKKEYGNRRQKCKFSSSQDLPSQPWAGPRNLVFQPAERRYRVHTPGTLADFGKDSSASRSSLSSSFLGSTYRSGSEAVWQSAQQCLPYRAQFLDESLSLFKVSNTQTQNRHTHIYYRTQFLHEFVSFFKISNT